MDNKQRDKKALKLFFLILLPASAVLETLYILLQNDIVMLLLMWTPGVAGIIVSQKYYKKENILGIRMGKVLFIILGIFLPLLYLGASYLVAWSALGDPTIGIPALAALLGMPADGSIPATAYVIVYSLVGLFISSLSAIGEELGWRGFLYPAMERVLGRAKALPCVGLIWAVWHMPIIIAGVYQAQTGLGYGLLMFAVCITLMSIIMAWTRSASGSVIPAILLHASHNLFDQSIFQPLSTNEIVPYYAGEQGLSTVGILLVMAAGAIFLWRRAEKKAARKTEASTISAE